MAPYLGDYIAYCTPSINRPIEHPNGDVEYYINGLRHRYEDLPSVIIVGGKQEYWYHGLLHRENEKPAVVWPNGVCEYWTHGIYRKTERCRNV